MAQSVKIETPQIKIVFQDEELIVIDKPAGLPSLPHQGMGKSNSVSEILSTLFPGAPPSPPPSPLEGEGRPALSEPVLSSVEGVEGVRGEFSREAGLVHRLDNETSGLMVAARTPSAYKKLRSMWNTKAVTKEYLALVSGITPEKGKISHPIAHHPSKKKKMIVCETVEKAKKYKARRAETEYQRMRTLSSPQPSPPHPTLSPKGRGGNAHTLLRVKITTGVRHQIRAHLAFISHPVVGDHLYQSKKQRALVGAGLRPAPTRHFLHLHRITLPHPMTGKMMTFESPLPEDLKIPLACPERSRRNGGG